MIPLTSAICDSNNGENEKSFIYLYGNRLAKNTKHRITVKKCHSFSNILPRIENEIKIQISLRNKYLWTRWVL